MYAGQGLCSVGMLLSRLLLENDLNLSRIQWVVSKLSSAWIDAKCVRRLLFDRGINADFIYFVSYIMFTSRTDCIHGRQSFPFLKSGRWQQGLEGCVKQDWPLEVTV